VAFAAGGASRENRSGVRTGYILILRERIVSRFPETFEFNPIPLYLSNLLFLNIISDYITTGKRAFQKNVILW
jgi:hypothetical protein